MAEKDPSLDELETRLKFFPRLREIFARELRSRKTKGVISSHPLLGWLSRFGKEPYARDMVFGIERALAELVSAPGYDEISPALKASGERFWSTLGHLSLVTFFRDIGWNVELERATRRMREGAVDLIVRWKEDRLGIEVKSISDLSKGWTKEQLEAFYRDAPQFCEEIREHPLLEPVPLRTREEVVRLVRSRALKARAKQYDIPCVLALDCTRNQEDAFLGEILRTSGDLGLAAVVTFSVGGSDLYPETRTIVKHSPWLETPLGLVFRSAWEGADRRGVLLAREAERITHLLVREYDPEVILLFGSVVHRRVRENSDLDILIIKRTEKPYYQRISEVISLASPSAPTDVFVYTPEEFDRLQREGDFFITREVLPTCERVYERPQAVA